MGGFTMGGLLYADSININLHYRCKVREIGGEKIEVKVGREFQLLRIIKSLFIPKGFHEPQLETDIIEGDEINLGQTKAEVVRGNNITIGKNCDIDLVEYRNSFEQTDNAQERNL
jgi:cytoskeletal protein CcmA (bactofilin family)